MSSTTERFTDKERKEYEAEISRESSMALANCCISSCWGITLFYGLFLYSHQGLAGIYYGEYGVPVDWTAFVFTTIGQMVILSILVTLLYFAFKFRYHRS